MSTSDYEDHQQQRLMPLAKKIVNDLIDRQIISRSQKETAVYWVVLKLVKECVKT